jgi:hypothetical protein
MLLHQLLMRIAMPLPCTPLPIASAGTASTADAYPTLRPQQCGLALSSQCCPAAFVMVADVAMQLSDQDETTKPAAIKG